MNLAEHPHITLCPTGKRALRRAPPTGELILAPPAREEHLTTLQRARQLEDALSVVQRQPHRRHADDPRDDMLGSALGRFCRQQWKKPEDRNARFNAGNEFASEVRRSLAVAGFGVVGLESAPGSASAVDISPEAVRIAAAARRAAEARVADADAKLRSIMPRLPAAMRRLCVDDLDPSPYDGGILIAGLYDLAHHYSEIDFGINWAKER